MSFKSDVQAFSRNIDAALLELSKAQRDPSDISRDESGKFSSTNTGGGTTQSKPEATPIAPTAGINQQVLSRGAVFDTANPNVRASNEWAAGLHDMYAEQRRKKIADRKARMERKHRQWRRSALRRLFTPEPMLPGKKVT